MGKEEETEECERRDEFCQRWMQYCNSVVTSAFLLMINIRLAGDGGSVKGVGSIHRSTFNLGHIALSHTNQQ